MKLITITLLASILAGCSGSPTAPTPPPVVIVQPPAITPPPSTPPVVTPPVIVPPPPSLPTSDPRFDMTFYRQFVHHALDGPLLPLRRQTQAPRIYLRTIDDAGAPIDALTLNQTASALESVTGKLTGVFGLAGLERGTDTRLGQPGWITVRWAIVPFESGPNTSVCGEAPVGGDLLTLYPKSRFCRCGGGPAVTLSIVKHEMGHALGFWHTNSREDLMYPTYSACDQEPSAREMYHAAVAYSMPNGSLAP